jgi:hypothetical protein
MSHTINTAIPTIPLTRETAEAEQQTTVAQVTYSSRPMTALFLSAKYRYSDVDIRTPVFDRLGSVSYDSSPQSSAGPSEYHSARRNTFDVDAAFTVAPRTQVKAGYGFYGGEFTHRIWEQTDENVFRLSVDTTGNEYFTVRALYEDRGRTGDGFRADALAEVGELPSMRHFDIADRDRRRFTLLGTAMPAGTVGLNASIGIGRDEYPDSQHGLQAYDTNQYSVGVDVVPGDRWELNAVFGWEDYASLQQSRNASDAVQQADPLRDWTTDYDGTVRYLDTTLLVREVFTRTNLRLGVEWNRAEDTYLYGIQPGSPIAPPEQLPPVINENTRAEIDLTHQITPRLWFGVTYWFDDYNVEDFALGPDTLSGIAFPPIEGNQPPNTATNSLLLGYLYRPYTAHTGFIRLTYRF